MPAVNSKGIHGWTTLAMLFACSTWRRWHFGADREFNRGTVCNPRWPSAARPNPTAGLEQCDLCSENLAAAELVLTNAALAELGAIDGEGL